MTHYCRSCQRLGHTPSESTAYHREQPSRRLFYAGIALVVVAVMYLAGNLIGGVL